VRLCRLRWSRSRERASRGARRRSAAAAPRRTRARVATSGRRDGGAARGPEDPDAPGRPRRVRRGGLFFRLKGRANDFVFVSICLPCISVSLKSGCEAKPNRAALRREATRASPEEKGLRARTRARSPLGRSAAEKRVVARLRATRPGEARVPSRPGPGKSVLLFYGSAKARASGWKGPGLWRDPRDLCRGTDPARGRAAPNRRPQRRVLGRETSFFNARKKVTRRADPFPLRRRPGWSLFFARDARRTGFLRGRRGRVTCHSRHFLIKYSSRMKVKTVTVMINPLGRFWTMFISGVPLCLQSQRNPNPDALLLPNKLSADRT